MDKKIRKEILKMMATSREGSAIKDWLKEAIEDIGNIDKAENWSDTVGRRKAKNKLKELFSFLSTTNETAKKTNPYE